MFDRAQTTPSNLEALATGDDRVAVVARVVRDSPSGDKQESVEVEAGQLSTGESRFICSVGIRLTIFSQRAEEEEARDAGAESALPVYTHGERLHFSAKLRTPPNYGNPGALDLAGYLASEGVRLTGSARASEVEILAWLRRQSHRAVAQQGTRRSVLHHIQQLWPGEPGALMQAMLTGGRAFFARNRKTDFQATGAGGRFAQADGRAAGSRESARQSNLLIGHHGSLTSSSLDFYRPLCRSLPSCWRGTTTDFAIPGPK